MLDRFRIDDEPWDVIYRAPLLVCPRCGGCSRARDVGQTTRVACPTCAFSRSWPSFFTTGSARGATPRWGPELLLRPWLVTPHRGRVLWATNVTHLDWLTSFVSADLRERSADEAWHNRAMGSRLPRWMKEAHARTALLRALAGLRERVPTWAQVDDQPGRVVVQRELRPRRGDVRSVLGRD